MTLLRRPAPRFVLWAALLVGVAAAAGFAGLSPWIIAGLEFGVWVGVAATERTLSGPWTTRVIAAHYVPVDGGEGLVAEPSLSNGQRTPQAEFSVEPDPSPVVEAAHEVSPEEPAPVAPAPPRRSAPPPAPAASGTQWNVWMLDQLVRDKAPDNEELVYLLVSLRDFADANGLLPAGFDPLVRESFGSLLPRAG